MAKCRLKFLYTRRRLFNRAREKGIYVVTAAPLGFSAALLIFAPHTGMSFDEYFAQKRGSGKTSLRRAQWLSAQKGNPTMLIWLGKQYLGQRDKSSHELSGPDGKPIETRSGLTDEQLDAHIERLMPKSLPKDTG